MWLGDEFQPSPVWAERRKQLVLGAQKGRTGAG